MRTQKLLVGLVVIQGLFLMSNWAGAPTAVGARPETSLPDPGARQLQMVDELKQLNAKVERLTTLLQSGEVTVKVAKDDAK